MGGGGGERERKEGGEEGGGGWETGWVGNRTTNLQLSGFVVSCVVLMMIVPDKKRGS